MRLMVTATLMTALLAGCVDSDGYVPGEGFKETGRTVHLRATVLDLLQKELYPGMEANLWAFCFEPADPNDEYSANAIEYQDSPGTVSDSTWQGRCSVPGPTLRVQQGDRVIVDFVNNHVHPHTIHWHGQYVPWESDGVPGSTQDSVNPQTTFRYDFIASRAGTLWYHCHVDTQFHVMQGLYGVMIVEPQDKSMEPNVDRDQVWTLSTLQRNLVEATPERIADPHAEHRAAGGCGVTGEQGCQNPPIDVTPDTFMINGVSFPNTLDREDTFIVIEPGEKVRLRILNAGTTWETIHTHGHDMLLTHVDGNPIPPSARYYVDTLPIGPANRYDVVIEGREGNEGVWVVHTHVVDHVTNDQQYPGGMLTKIVYPEYLDDKTPFEGVELPGGMAYTPAHNFPDDFGNVTRRGLGTTISVDESWAFEVEEGCAVRSIWFTVEVDSPTSAAQALNDIHVDISGPDGDHGVFIEMENTRYAEWRLEPNAENHLDSGNYTVHMEGRSTDAVARMTVFIDYFDSRDEHEDAGAPCDEVH